MRSTVAAAAAVLVPTLVGAAPSSPATLTRACGDWHCQKAEAERLQPLASAGDARAMMALAITFQRLGRCSDSRVLWYRTAETGALSA